ncbi:TetR family transcriptional regulator [Sinorhizobium meliloti]|uniref:TetR family transcriptional regulator n=1 Tax=Rhizobium meliloti TaxID=382 RepID=UPI000FDB148F|nr:TetR family transcriptional regulator [Sinorhizobium meliloti]RVG14617.1 TetR family transcriptional regulator [Sinorhizobium meliloti]
MPSRIQKTSLSPGADTNVAAVADEAGISRATAYRYFSDSATLAMEAVLDGAVVAPEKVIPERASTREGVRRYWLSFYSIWENRLRVFAARACSRDLTALRAIGARHGACRCSGRRWHLSARDLARKNWKS